MKSTRRHTAAIEIVWTKPEATPLGRNDERVIKLARINFVPFLGEKYARKLRHGPSRFDELRRLDLVTLRDYQHFSSDGALGNWNDLVAHSRRPVVANWTAAMAELTLGGSGVSLLPDYSVLYSRGLLRVDAPAPQMSCDLWMKAEVDDLKEKRIRKCFDGLAKVFHSFQWDHR